MIRNTVYSILASSILVFSQQPLGDVWLFLGDSQTAGRAPEVTVSSSAKAFENIYRATFVSHDPSVRISGVGGCTLFQSAGRYSARSNKSEMSLIHFQESGGQLKSGQRTVNEYLSTLQTVTATMQRESPNAVLSVETAYSFQREDEAGRDWAEYNRVLKNHVVELQSQGVPIVLSSVDHNIKALVEERGFNSVMMDDGAHYRGVGNLMVALSVFEALGYDVLALNLDVIPESDVSQGEKNICLQIITGTVPVVQPIPQVPPVPPIPPTTPSSYQLEIPVSYTEDDAEELMGGRVSLTSSDLELVDDRGRYTQVVGIRFRNVTLPVGAQVSSAHISFTVDEVQTSITNLEFRIEDTGNAAPFSPQYHSISQRTVFDRFVSWHDVSPWMQIHEIQESPDLSSLIELVVTRSGWTRGNALSFIVSGSGVRTAESYDGNRRLAPVLHVTYTLGAVQNRKPTVHAGIDQEAVLAEDITLVGVVTDDGYPVDTEVVTTWSQIAGPVAITIGNSGALQAQVQFPEVGEYQFQLRANDSEYIVDDTIGVVVTEERVPPVIRYEIRRRVADGDDDAEESDAGRMLLTSSDLELIDDKGSPQKVGIRFTDIHIPAGANIVEAYIEFVADEIHVRETALNLFVEDTDDAQEFSIDPFDISERTLRSTSVSWNAIPEWLTVGQVDRTSDIASLVQHSVNNGGWRLGNAIAFIITGSGLRTAESYNGKRNAAPLLYVAYELE